MLLRAYIIRLADGLVAFPDSLCWCKGLYLQGFGNSTVYNVKKIILEIGTPGTLYRGHGGHATLKIWLAARIVVPLHRQSIDG